MRSVAKNLGFENGSKAVEYMYNIEHINLVRSIGKYLNIPETYKDPIRSKDVKVAIKVVNEEELKTYVDYWKANSEFDYPFEVAEVFFALGCLVLAADPETINHDTNIILVSEKIFYGFLNSHPSISKAQLVNFIIDLFVYTGYTSKESYRQAMDTSENNMMIDNYKGLVDNPEAFQLENRDIIARIKDEYKHIFKPFEDYIIADIVKNRLSA